MATLNSTSTTASPPLAKFSPTDHRAPLWVATLICLVFVTLGVLTRLYVRFKALGVDDIVIFVAFIVGLAEFLTTIVGLIRGLGQSDNVLSDEKIEAMGQVFLATEGLFIVGLYIVKASVLLTVERVLGPDQKRQRLICWFLQGVQGLCGIGSLTAVLANCNAAFLLTVQKNNQCSAQGSRWIAIATIDSVTEILTFVAFGFFISGLQMATRLKVTVTLLLAFRLACLAFAAIHAKYIHIYVSSADPGLGVVGALVWQQLNLAYSLIAALLIALKGFLQSFDMKFGNDQTYIRNSRSGSRGDRYNLKPLSKKTGGSNSSGWDKRDRSIADLRSEYENGEIGYTTKAYRGEDDVREGSVRSGISQHPIIRYQVEYQISHEQKDPPRGTSDP